MLRNLLIATVIFASPALCGAADALFDEAPARDKGWQGLANVLQRLSPRVDTRVPLTPSQITDRIAAMISQGQYDEALAVIARRKAQREQENLMGDDVQLMFLEARALAAVGRPQDAIAVYRDMTVQYPELPEPWNNLAAEYARQGNLALAEQALQTALASDPDYAAGRLNLGIVQLMLARESLEQAAASGSSEARALADATARLLQP